MSVRPWQLRAIPRATLAPLVAAGILLGATDATSAQWEASRLFAYPRQGQSPQQQNVDLTECHYWAVNQTGYDPNFATGNEPQDKRFDYQRAMSACLEARGYSVR